MPCGHCRIIGHNRSSCKKFDMDIVLNIHGRQHDCYRTEMRQTIRMRQININKLAQVKLLIEEKIPFMIFDANNTTGHKHLVRLENNKINVSEDEVVTEEIETTNKVDISLNHELLHNYMRNYVERIQHVRRNCRWSEYQSINNLITIINGDYIEYVRNIVARQNRQDAAYQLVIEQRRNNENAAREFTNRQILPIIRETPIESSECPICIEPLGETNKVILRCGHQVCLHCILTYTLRSAATRSIDNCKCPVCRNSFL